MADKSGNPIDEQQAANAEHNSDTTNLLATALDADKEGGKQSETPQKDKVKIRGWLRLFLNLFIIFWTLFVFFQIIVLDKYYYDGVTLLGVVNIVAVLLFLGVALFTFYAFKKRRGDAVFWGKSYGVIGLATNTIFILWHVLIGREIDAPDLQHVALNTLFTMIWLLYLTFSKQVQKIIPKSIRKISSLNWRVLIALILLPVILHLIVGFIYAYQMLGTWHVVATTTINGLNIRMEGTDTTKWYCSSTFSFTDAVYDCDSAQIKLELKAKGSVKWIVFGREIVGRNTSVTDWEITNIKYYAKDDSILSELRNHINIEEFKRNFKKGLAKAQTEEHLKVHSEIILSRQENKYVTVAINDEGLILDTITYTRLKK